jgi:DNA polymerase-3 subunit delta'
VTGFESIIGQNKPVATIQALLRRETIPHALLFTGTEGVGKFRAAVEFAKACNCRNRYPACDRTGQSPGMQETAALPCDACGACRKIGAGVHPDVLLIEPAGAFIRIESIRSLQHSLSMRPYEADVRVVIVTGAQHMTPSASNAFLKMLEEPPPRTVLILIAERVSEMMPTVVSRCRRIHFNPIPRRQLADLLAAEAGIRPELAHTAAAFSGGSYTRSQKLVENGWFRLRDWIIQEFQQLPQMPVGRLLALADRLAADTRLLSDALDVLTSWLRDLLVVRFYPAGVIHQDQADDLCSQAAQIPVEGVMARIQAVREAQMDLRGNVNARLVAETLLLQLSRGEAVRGK